MVYCPSVIIRGFENLPAPDMETFSKALTGGQYPLSLLALNASAAQLYRSGVYGNTMTTNPRALDVAVAILNSITPELRQNVEDRGREFLDKLKAMQDELGGSITKVQGTGLLCSVPNLILHVSKAMAPTQPRSTCVTMVSMSSMVEPMHCATRHR